MKYYLIILLTCLIGSVMAQAGDSTKYKKRVLDAAEVDFLFSYYAQDGEHSAVGGGIGNENLKDMTPTIIVSLPLNADDVLSIDVGISAYSSASSSNINPFNVTDAVPTGSPWIASSGASKQDALTSLNVNYTHSSDDRNKIFSANVNLSKEYDYSSLGFGAGYAILFNHKNTELNIKTQVYLDTWNAIYPTELHEYDTYGSDFLDRGFFQGATVRDENGVASTDYSPTGFNSFSDNKRNSYSASLGFSQILTRNMQVSFFLDVINQQGLLSTPYQRVYFADKANYFVGSAEYISTYTSPTNIGVFQLADDVERLPDSRLKIPVGVRMNYFVNEFISLRSYYRYYQDNWGLKAHTMSIEVPVKLGGKITLYPNYRYYTQQQADYFAPFDTHLSNAQFYTSDYDLSTFNSQAIGFGISYKDIFTSLRIGSFGLKNIDLRYQNYQRNDGLKADIVSLAAKFVLQ